MRVRVLIEMDDGASGIRAVNALDSAMREYNEKLRRADPSAEIDFEVLGTVPGAEVRAGVVAEEPEWEFQVVNDDPKNEYEGGPITYAEALREANMPGDRIERRRKAGPWVPVEN